MNSSVTLQLWEELAELSPWQIIKINGFIQLQSSTFPHIHSQSCKLLGRTMGIYGCRNTLDEKLRFARLKPFEILSQRAFLHGGDVRGYLPRLLEFSSQEIRWKIGIIKVGKALRDHRVQVLSQHCQGHHGLTSQNLLHSLYCWKLFPEKKKKKD